jgi:small conductance mechanosensitive channel
VSGCTSAIAALLAVVIWGFLIALSIVAQSFQAAELIKVLGVGTMAIGFAFQNILQNPLAGILILIHEPCRLGDFITITSIEGVVEDIQTRATVISTANGHRVVIPNAVLFTNRVVVRNADYKKDLETNEAESVPARQESGR